MNLASDFDHLIAAIYQAAIEPETWPEILAAVSTLTGQASLYLCHVPTVAPGEGNIWTHAFDPDCLAVYKLNYAGQQYSGVRLCLTLPPGQLVDRRAYFDDAAFFADPGHRDFLVAQGLTEVVMGPIYRDQRTTSVLLCARTARQGALSSDEFHLLQQLVPHFTRSMAIQQRLAGLDARVEFLAGAIADLDIGVLTVTAEMEVLFTNKEAERLLAATDGLARRNGRLEIFDPPSRDALRDSIARLAVCAGNSTDPCLFIKRPSGHAPLTVVVGSLAHGVSTVGGHVTPRAIATLLITDPACRAALPSPSLLAKGLGLTATEAEVARLAVMGRGMGFVADSLGISLNTARTHLKAIYGKTGVNHQAALTRTIADRFPPIVGLAGEKSETYNHM